MLLTFPSDKTIELSFKLGIAGTSAAPSNVAVVLGKDNKKLSFNATKQGDEWKAIVENPGASLGHGDVTVAVQVILNNQLFSPLKTQGKINFGDYDTINFKPVSNENEFSEIPRFEEPVATKEDNHIVTSNDSKQPAFEQKIKPKEQILQQAEEIIPIIKSAPIRQREEVKIVAQKIATSVLRAVEAEVIAKTVDQPAPVVESKVLAKDKKQLSTPVVESSAALFSIKTLGTVLK